jgi:hypothetical protein
MNCVLYLQLKGMQYIQDSSRHQTYYSTLENQVGADNPVRLIDSFVNMLHLQKLSFTKTVHGSEGRPPYAGFTKKAGRFISKQICLTIKQ